MEQIAETVDIAKGTLYNYFPSKEAIINAFLQQRFADHSADWIATLHKLPDTHSRMTFVFSLLIDGVKRQRNLFEAFMVYRMKQILSFTPIEESAQTGLSLLIREIVQLGQQNNELRSDLPDMLLDELFEFALIEAIKPMYLMPEVICPGEIHQVFHRFVYARRTSLIVSKELAGDKEYDQF